MLTARPPKPSTLCKWHKELKTMSEIRFHMVEILYTLRVCAANGARAGGDPHYAQWLVIQRRK